MELDPDRLAIPDRYKLLIGCIVPRPIAWVSTVSPVGLRNLAPFSFFAGVSSNPMSLLFCPANRDDGTEKDTLRNCKPREEGGTGEFVVNVATEEASRQMAACAEPLAYGESEFALAGVHEAPSAVVGRVVHIAVRDGLLNERMHTDPARLAAIGRMGGLGYCLTRERFEMPMGALALPPLDTPPV